MYKVAILGCENSHADFFLKDLTVGGRIHDVEVVGIYSNEEEAAKRLSTQFHVPILTNYTDCVGKIDGVIITARDGNNHYLYAKPYLKSGIPMFIDKPITITEQDAKIFMGELVKRNIQVSGGSMCKYAPYVQELKRIASSLELGRVYGGYVKAPVSLQNAYGNFYFYSQHLVQVLCEIFGYDVKSVQVFGNGGVYTCVFRYAEYDVTGVYTNENYTYYAGITCEKGCRGSEYTIATCAEQEVDAFYHILTGGEQEQSYADFFAPVPILNALERSVKSAKPEMVRQL